MLGIAKKKQCLTEHLEEKAIDRWHKTSDTGFIFVDSLFIYILRVFAWNFGVDKQ